MKILSETTQPDASAWVAVVEVAGVLFRASFVACQLSVGLAPYKHRPRRPRWAEKSVRTWAEKRVKELPTVWMAMHRELYAQEAG